MSDTRVRQRVPLDQPAMERRWPDFSDLWEESPVTIARTFSPDRRSARELRAQAPSARSGSGCRRERNGDGESRPQRLLNEIWSNGHGLAKSRSKRVTEMQISARSTVGYDERVTSLPNNQHEYEGGAASRYDSARTTDLKWAREQEIVKRYLGAVVNKESLVLDVPVGTGRFIPLYDELGCSSIGVDVSDDMLEEARKLGGRTRLVRGDITSLDLDDQSVDVSVCIRLANLIPLGTVSDALDQLHRVTRSHIVLGVRTYERRAAPRQVLRRLRARLRRRPDKLTIHSSESLQEILAAKGAEVVEQELVVEAAHGSSSYRIYLLRVK